MRNQGHVGVLLSPGNVPYRDPGIRWMGNTAVPPLDRGAPP